MLYKSKNPAPVEVAPSSEEIDEGVAKLQAKTDHNLKYVLSIVYFISEFTTLQLSVSIREPIN